MNSGMRMNVHSFDSGEYRVTDLEGRQCSILSDKLLAALRRGQHLEVIVLEGALACEAIASGVAILASGQQGSGDCRSSRDRLMPSITFDFFGQVRVHVPTVDDALHLCRYYRDYRIADHSCVSPMFEVRLLAADGISFIEALLSRSILKSIGLRRYGGEWELYETFSHKPSKVTQSHRSSSGKTPRFP